MTTFATLSGFLFVGALSFYLFAVIVDGLFGGPDLPTPQDYDNE